VRIVTAVHDPPVWTLPRSEVRRITSALKKDVVLDARTPDERRKLFPTADILLATKLTAEEARLLKRVRWIQSTAVGVTELLAPEVLASRVTVTNVRGVHAQQIAEHAIALVLALRRRLHVAAARQAAREWAQVELQAERIPMLTESRLLVIGLGEIGSRVAALGSALGMHVTGIRRRVSQPKPPGIAVVMRPTRLRDALADADAVVLAAPRTMETKAMIGVHELAAMKRSAVLVNVARGRLIDDDALVAALERGQIAAAGLDAFASEPLPADHPYWRLPSVLMTPHTACFGADYWQAAVDFFLMNRARFERGDALLNVVDKARGY